jgi:outer membrane protein assembly factor BamE (lipoprotein component of BamABCDE complex)
MSGTVVTMDTFSDIPVGATTSEVVACAGTPYSIRKCEDGTVEYEYIERIKIGDRDAEERHYFLLIKNGQVVSKRVKQSGPIPYYLNSFDSYQMQTTQNGEE